MFLRPNTVKAQNAISLSVTPPLLELTIQPGKEVKQTYSVGSDGSDVILVPKIVYFTPSDENGGIDLTEDDAPNWIKYNKDPIKIKNGGKVEYNVIISPPSDTEEIDHFLTLIFETQPPSDVLTENSVFYKSKIGTNILLTISKDGNPKKAAEIVNFNVPKIIDSIFNSFDFDVVLRNSGNSFWKPNGKITVNGNRLKLAPQNILSGTNRKISCLDNENLVSCSIKNKFFVGKVVSAIEFSLDDDPKIYKKEVTTIAFPFSLTVIVLTLLTLIRLQGILKVWRKRA